MSAHRKHRQPMLMATAAGLAMLLLALTFLHVAAADGTTSTDLFFSEYIEGSSNNKALEIYNGTGAPVDLGAGNYSIELYSNGSATPTGVFSPTGTLADGDVYVITTDQADPTIQTVATISLTYPSVAHFNGDDALLLKHNGAIIDRIGRVGEDPGSEWGSGDTTTKEHTLVRKCGIEDGDPNAGDPFDPAVQWDGYPQNTFGFLGWHIVPCPAAAPELTIEKSGPLAATAGNDMDYLITFGNAGDLAADTVVITDDLPGPGVTYVGYTDTAGLTLVSADDTQVVWSLTSIPSQTAGLAITLTVHISDTVSGLITNTVTITTTTAGDDPVNNADDHVTDVSSSAAVAPARLLLTEIVVTPTEGEFVEIYNPNNFNVDLSDYYLTDATYANGGVYYYNIVTGANAGGGGFGDFHARFPDGAVIGPGEYQTISLAGSDDFFAEYGVNPTYELFEDGASSDAIPDMREALPGSINGQGGLSNSGEVVILYYWDGASDLVQDIDYGLWGDKDEAVDKTGVTIGASTYLSDTAIASQDIILDGSHADGSSFQRMDYAEGAEVPAGGNGVDGNDETSEDLSNTWSSTFAPTPGQPAPAPSLLLTEIVVTPTEGEFVEIYNPNGFNVDLSDYYLTDATYANGGVYYYNIVTGANAGGGGFGDFHARFPDGAVIGPGEYQTISLPGSDDFFAEYGVNPTYELFEDGASPDAIPDMREALPGSINGQGGLSNSGEVVIFYHWDGQSDLVGDVDYGLWGDKDEAVDKTGVTIGASTYLSDTAIANQDVLRDGSHDFGNSWQRDDLAEGAEIKSGGNGVDGNDETSEDLSNTWCEAAPTPLAASQCPAATNLAVFKDGPVTVVAGQDITYTITISNSGVSTATNVLLTDTLPVSTTYVSDGIGTPANPTPGVYVWTLGEVGPGASDVYTLTVSTDGNLTGGTVLTNTVEVSTDAAGDDPADNQDSAETAVSTGVDLSVVKTGPTYGVIGEDIVYTITVDAAGIEPPTSVVLTDSLPVSTTYAGDNAFVAPTNPTPGVYVWDFGDQPAGWSYSFNITVTAESGLLSGGDVVSNSVQISTSAAGDDPANNEDDWATIVYPLVSIYDIQTPPAAAAKDASPLEGQVVWTEGVVTAQPGEIDNPSRMMVIQDPAGGAFSGLPVFRASGFGGLSAPEGTQLRVLGTVTEYFGLTELNLDSAPWAVQVLGTQAPLAPEVLTTAAFDDADPATSEAWEGVLLEFQNAEVTNDSLGYGEWYFDDSSGNARGDDLGSNDGNLTYAPTNGDQYAFIRGIGWYSFSHYKLEPRYNADIGLAVDTPGISKDAAVLVAPGDLFTYTITVENQIGYDLTDVVISDVVPAGTTFAYALDGGAESSGVVSWTIPTLAYLDTIDVRFAVTATLVPTTVVNSDYAVAAANFVTPTYGTPLATVVDSELRIHHIQAAAHVSPLDGRVVQDVPGEVTAVASDGFYMQDPVPDADNATSEGIFVYTGGSPGVTVGDSLLVDGTVAEFYPGGLGSGNLPRTQLTNASWALLASRGPQAPSAITPIVIGIGGRIPPQQVIEDDVSGNVETSGVFDPDTDGLDFYESLEGMLVQVNDAVAASPTTRYGEIAVLSDNGANASVRTGRGGIVIRPGDFNPERVIIDDGLQPNEPQVDVGDRFDGPVVGVLDYSFGNFKLLNPAPLPAVIPGGLAQETANAPTDSQFTIATFNVENLDPGDPASKFQGLAEIIVDRLQSPDIIALEEIQDSTGPTDDGVVDATDTYTMLISAITTAGGPTYDFRDIAPQNNMDGGQPGANIRVGFLFRTDRGMTFVDRPGGDATTATTPVIGGTGVELTLSPGRVDPTNMAFDDSRKPLAGEFVCNGSQRLFIVGNHFNSKGGDNPLFGRVQPPERFSEIQRKQQAQVVNDFVDSILALEANAKIVVLGDLNDFQFSEAVSDTLKADVLTNLIDGLSLAEQYTYIYNGNSQVLDHILVSDGLLANVVETDVVHVNAEFDHGSRASDHDPVLVRFTCAGPTAVELNGLDAEATQPAPVASLPWQAIAAAAALAMGLAAAARRR